ncbi:prolipoprotein diacylglyceryl transferase [Myxococcota bacterium]|nr:prolipoprotein diacylglyceryl transferase [Myxococcota bacterium]
MRPILFEIFGVTFPSYYTMLTLGFLLIAYLGKREADRVGINPDDFLDLTFWMFVFGLIGARILHVFADGYFWDYVHLCTDPLQVKVASFIHVPCKINQDCVLANAGGLCHPETLRCYPEQDCLAALKFWQGGLAFYGGLIMAVAYAVYFIRKHKMAVAKTFDIAGWGVALGLGFGRMGCFLAGCCFGQITDAPTALEFPGYVIEARVNDTCPKNYDFIESDKGIKYCAWGRPAFLNHVKHDLLPPKSRHSHPVHATQLYELAFSWSIFAWLYFWRRKRARYSGQLFVEFALLYGIGRFVVEFFRADDRGLWLGGLLSTSQIIALPFIFVALYLMWRWRHKVTPPEPPLEPPLEPPEPGEAR